MKKITFLLALLFAPVLSTAQEDKDFLLDYFEETRDNLKDQIRRLTPEQMSFKASEEDWSIAQCVEHIIMTEKSLFEMMKKLMEQPANPERKDEVVSTAQELIEGITNRSHKFKAPENLQPSGKYTNPEEAFAEFEAQREQIVDYLKNTEEEALRNHITDTPMGVTDAYYSFLFLAGHTARHTLQIKEVKGSPGFPD